MYKLFTDGGSRGNPGPAAIGTFIFDENDNLVTFLGEYLGEETNNFAEYTALIRGLKLAAKEGIDSIECNLDSELVVKQLNGQYKVKNENIIPLHKKVETLKKEFKSISFVHVRREFNKHADRMVNIILDTLN